MGSKTLYVGNLSYQSTEEDVRQLFSAYDPGEVRIIPDKGFGFVDVPEDKAAEAIAAINGTNFQQRNLTVNEARPRGERSGGGNRGGGGGYRGGNRSGGYGGDRGGGRGRRF